MPDLIANEELVRRYWDDERVREAVNLRNKDGKVFFFLEGPPYANGELHMGHIRGYVRKDAILRYRRMRGQKVFDRAGFDVHGLPIENKVERQLEIKSKREIETRIGVENFVRACIETYKRYVAEQIAVAKAYGVWFDFENAYIPASFEYMDRSWGVFKRIFDKGLVYRAKQVMPYCIHCGTVLAKGPEVEEQEDTDPSMYVGFKTSNPAGRAPAAGAGASLLIWTTTPWTIPGNMAVAVNPKEPYVRVAVSGREFILAKVRLGHVASELGWSPIIMQEFRGADLEGVHYLNPLEDSVPRQKDTRRNHKVIFSEEMVSMGEGTGIIHIAPAFGPEDFELAKKEKIPLLSIVGLDGRYNSEAGKYAGIGLIHDANREIELGLSERGALIGKGAIRHSYPHCWRCKDKLVYLPTEQWFINVSRIKARIRKEIEKVEWHPGELKAWFTESINSAPDWVISRQRYWDIPIPIWICGACGEAEAIGSFEELQRRAGSDMAADAEAMHRPSVDRMRIKCGKCNGVMERISDVFDVWYDSGVAHTASLTKEEFAETFSKAFITEGPDQIRGWFATLMKTGVAAYGKTPFRTVLMQGWVLDHKGEAMHKSKGNYVAAQDLVGKYSMDAVRLFTLSHPAQDSLKF